MQESPQQQNNSTMLSYLDGREGLIIIAWAIQSLTKGNPEKVSHDSHRDRLLYQHHKVDHFHKKETNTTRDISATAADNHVNDNA